MAAIRFIHYAGQTGKLLEHLDSLAGSIAYKYVLGASVEKLGAISDVGFYIVTASVDRYVRVRRFSRLLYSHRRDSTAWTCYHH